QIGTIQIIHQTGCKFDFNTCWGTGSGTSFIAGGIPVILTMSASLPAYALGTTPPPTPPATYFPVTTPLSFSASPTAIVYLGFKSVGPMGEVFPIVPATAYPNVYNSLNAPPCNNGNNYKVVWTNPSANIIVIYILP